MLLSDSLEFISNNKALISTIIKYGYIDSETELFSSVIGKANKLLSEIEIYKVYYKRCENRIQKLDTGNLLDDNNCDLYWLFFGMGQLIFNDKSELERKDLYDVAARYGVLGNHLGIDYILAINEKSVPILKEYFNSHCSRFFYIKNYKKVTLKDNWPKITALRFVEDEFGRVSREDIDDLEKFREIAADKTVLFTGIERPYHLVYKDNGKRRVFSVNNPLETLHHLGLVDTNTIVVSCYDDIAEELGLGSIDGFYSYNEWFREKFLEKYGNVDFSCLIRFEYEEDKFLSDISVRDVYNIYKGFTEAALEKHKETYFYKTIIANVSGSLEASKIMNSSAGRVLLNKNFVQYLNAVVPELKIGYITKEEYTDYIKIYPLLRYIGLSDLCLDIGLPGPNGVYDVNENRVYKLYRDILDYALSIERLQD